jgi:YYY domain-containing protein
MEWFEIIKWWLVLELIGFAALPLTTWIFGNLKDNGITLTKIMGLLFVTYFSWVLTHMGYNYGTVIVGLSVLMVLAISLVIFSFKGCPFDLKALVRTEILFTLAFLVFVTIRAYSPDIYWTGGEKLMDMSFVNMILRSTSFPPVDPWLSGEPMQYYYFGYLVAANLIKLSNVLPSIGFNLGVATMFALSATAAYGIGKDLVSNNRVFALIIMAFVVIFGNPAGFIQLLVTLFVPKYHGLFNVPPSDVLARLSSYNYWPTSRVIPNTINEFPYFSFIQADLHAHMIAIAFQLLMIALLLNLLREGKEYNIPLLAVITLLLGFMFPLNSWDYPTYAIFFVMVLAAWRIRVFAKVSKTHGFTGRIFSVHPVELAKLAVVGAVVIISSILLYLPYHLLASNVSHSLNLVTYGQTGIIFYLGVFGIMLFFLLVYSILNFYDHYYPDMKMILAGLVIVIVAAYLTHIEILVIILPLIVMSMYLLVKEEDPSIQFIYLLILLGALLSLFCELFYIQDSFGITSPQYIRFNTVFKVYVQHWIVWALAAGAAFYHLWNRGEIEDIGDVKDMGGMKDTGNMGNMKDMANVTKKGFAIISIILVLAAMSYPVFATYSRSGNFKGNPTLDGAAYLEQQYQNEYNAIMWLDNLNGTPVVLQSPGQAYKLNTHVTAFTGLPTVLGWAGHEKNWRNGADIVNERWYEVPRVYTSSDVETVNGILDKYNVEYIYVGGVEEERYGGHDARKLFMNNQDRFRLVYFNPNVYIYQVVRPVG